MFLQAGPANSPKSFHSISGFEDVPDMYVNQDKVIFSPLRRMIAALASTNMLFVFGETAMRTHVIPEDIAQTLFKTSSRTLRSSTPIRTPQCSCKHEVSRADAIPIRCASRS